MTKKYALIVAGGKGSRMNSAIAKQFIQLNRLPILMHTMNKFYTYDASIEFVLVLPKLHFSYWRKLCSLHNFGIKHKLVAGGEVRFDSVKNGLNALEEDGLVAIHDGVRPFVSLETIKQCYNIALERGNAIPVMPVVDSLRKVEKHGNFSVDRSTYFQVQTPQVFRLNEIKKAYELDYNPVYTDDAMVLERTGKKINLVEGTRENMKITHPTDLLIAETFLKNGLV